MSYRRFVCWVLCGICLIPSSAAAQPDRGAKSQALADAQRHFNNGIKLYNDGNYHGALAEFEAAYRLKPGASSLKNIALSQKALFRYSQAAQTLERALSQHQTELDKQDKAQIQTAIAELKGLVGSVVVTVNVPGAKLSVDGRALTSHQAKRPILLNSGEHTISATAPGHAQARRIVRIAGGQKRVAVNIELRPIKGFVKVTSEDQHAAIGIDGNGLAYGSWQGWLKPGEHYVQVYRTGFQTFGKRFEVAVGERLHLKAPSLEPSAESEEENGTEQLESPPGAKPKTKLQRGWYGLLSLNGTGVTNNPDGFDLEHADTNGAAVGARAGYRIWQNIGVEWLMEFGRHNIDNACDEKAVSANVGLECDGADAASRNLNLSSFRVGPNLRLMSGGERLRFSSTLGAGAVRHELELGSHPTTPPPTGAQAPGKVSGWDPYFLLELGLLYNWGHILLGADLVLLVDGASNVQGTNDAGENWTPYADTNGLIVGGLGIRLGWSEWSP